MYYRGNNMKTKDLLKEWRSYINESGPYDKPVYGGPDDYDFTLDERFFKEMKENCEIILGDIDYDPNSFNVGVDLSLYRALKNEHEVERDDKIKAEVKIFESAKSNLSSRVKEYSDREYRLAEKQLEQLSNDSSQVKIEPEIRDEDQKEVGFSSILSGIKDVAEAALHIALNMDPMTISSDEKDRDDSRVFKDTVERDKQERLVREAKLRDIIYKKRIESVINTFLNQMRVIGFTEESMNVAKVFDLARDDNVDYIFYNAKFVIDVEGNLYVKKKDGSLVSLVENIFPFEGEDEQ
jgi:hypothetical protein